MKTPKQVQLTGAGTLKLRDMETAGKAEYGNPLATKYLDFTHVIRCAFHPSRLLDSRGATSTSILDYMLTA